jgi:hypothetical protein
VRTYVRDQARGASRGAKASLGWNVLQANRRATGCLASLGLPVDQGHPALARSDRSEPARTDWPAQPRARPPRRRELGRELSRAPTHMPGGGQGHGPRRRHASSSRLHALLGGRVQEPVRDRILELRCTNGPAVSAVPDRLLGIDREAILLSLNVYTNNGLSIEEIEAYWLDLLDLPSSSVRKHMLNHRPTSSSGRAKTSARTASARCACTTPGCSSTSTGRFRSTGVSTNRLGCARAIMSGLGR